MRFAGSREFVTGRCKSDDGPAAHLDSRDVTCCNERKIARVESLACGNKHIALVEIEPRLADVPRRCRSAEYYAIAIGICVFLEQDGVGAFRYYAAGENAHRFAFANFAGKGMAGRRRADDAKLRTIRIREPDRIAVHGRDRGGGLIARRDDIACENAAMALFKRNDFAVKCRHGRCNARDGFFDGNHSDAAA
jgi:hypothetical protein